MLEQEAVATGGLLLDEAAVQALSAGVRGEVLRPGSSGFEAARKVWNGMIDKTPAVIVRCAGVSDVISAVNFARDNDLVVAVRGGGHNVTGNATCDRGLVIDLSPMKAVRVDHDRRTARAEGGVTWEEFNRETQAFGLATTGGVVSTTGIAGLTLGGGVGWLVRKHGMSSDNVLSADIVTADGRLRTASENENEDLFWALRGGGGNFGVVTSLEYRLHPVGPVLGGMVLHQQSDAKAVLGFYRDFTRTAPDELTTYCGFLTTPDGVPVVGMIPCYCGPLEEGEAVLRPLRDFGTPIADLVQPMGYCDMNTLLDAAFPAGMQNYWKSGFVEDLSDAAIDVLVDRAARMTSPRSALIIEYYGGAASRVGEDATAFPHRQAQYDVVITAQWADPTESDLHSGWARETWEALQPFGSGRVYVNTLGVEGDERVREAYGANYDRLVQVKNTYDPTNFFRLNQNIKPTV
jgi:FAD binding domain/Berberine and berberine like